MRRRPGPALVASTGVARGNLLGEFLTARRQRVVPADVGLNALGKRQVRGLRREEVAFLAGISADYYVRLEQGRDRNPSAQVLRSLSRVLCLDEVATAHLLVLGSTDPPPSDAPGGTAAVPASVGQLLRAISLPAFVEDEHFDVQESNSLARALSPLITPGRNRVLTTFLEPSERLLFLDWDDVAAELVAAFRASLADSADDRRAVELVAELSVKSSRFNELWARHDVGDFVDRPPVRLCHPELKELTLTRDNIAIGGRQMRLVLYHAELGTESFDKLGRLGR